MLFETGFLGTKAPFYIDFITVYFTFLPFLLAYSIYLASKKELKKHFITQAIILAFTLIIVVIFEIGIRISGGFIEYSKDSLVSYNFMLIFLIIHIIIAIAAVGGWLYLFISTYKSYKKNGFSKINGSNHKKIGKAIFLSLSISSIMGICMYLFLFVY